jgi:hypothetical protein
MTKQYRSPGMASFHETAEGLRAAGVMDKQTMRKFDDACLTPVRALTPEEIRVEKRPYPPKAYRLDFLVDDRVRFDTRSASIVDPLQRAAAC